MRTAQDNAREFGRLTSQGYGVHLALLAACSVEKQQGKATSPSRGKLSVKAFALVAEVGYTTVSRYLDKWDRLVEKGWDVSRDTLTPDSVDTLNLTHRFVSEFDALATRDSNGKLVGLDGKAADVAANKPALRAAILADPAVAKVAMKAITESSHRGAGDVSHVNMPPETAAGRATKAKLEAANKADETVSARIYEAAILLNAVRRELDENEPNLGKRERSQIVRTLTDIIVAAESIRMEFDLAAEARAAQ